MEELQNILEESMNEDLYQIVISNPRNPQKASKVKVRPVILKEELWFQETIYRGTQVFHQNLDKRALTEKLLGYFAEDFKQGEISTKKHHSVILISKKGKITVKVKRNKETGDCRARLMEHNRTKKYILEEGKPIDFLVGLGVQTPEGKIVKAKYDKYRQINRYLEFVEDVLKYLPTDRPVRIIDFGCGKSYLTFALYYYLHELKQRQVQITGLDLKEDVIDHCNELARKYGYEGLKFEKGNISTYEGETQADMVVSLHACDTATDFALEKAVSWKASVILAVPCCQHELNQQIDYPPMEQVLRYGIIKERMAALLTDAIRAELLQAQGYDTQILEFIDIENTPKNLLIRAVKRPTAEKKESGAERDALSKMLADMKLHPTLQTLFEGKQK